MLSGVGLASYPKYQRGYRPGRFGLQAGRKSKAECRLHRLAQRGARKLLAERHEYEERKRQLRCQRVSAPPPDDPKLFFGLGWARWRARRRVLDHPRWFVTGRREAERRLLDQHARKLLRDCQKKRLRLRDEAIARERAAAAPQATEHIEVIAPPDARRDAPAPIRINPTQPDSIRAGPIRTGAGCWTIPLPKQAIGHKHAVTPSAFHAMPRGL